LFYLPKKWFEEDVDKKVENKSGISNKRINLFILLLISVAMSILFIIIKTTNLDYDTLIFMDLLGWLF
jgi:hypothetical protein